MPAPDWTVERDTLQFYIEKADKLLATRFVQMVQEGNVGLTVHARVGEEMRLERRLPDQEAIDAFVLTFRFFIQDNERISIRNMAALFEALPLSGELKRRVRLSRNNLNTDLHSTPAIQINEGVGTNWDVMQTFIYGLLAHGNEDKRRLVEDWIQQGPIIFSFLNLVFLSTLTHVLEFVAWLRGPVLEALDELPPGSPIAVGRAQSE